MKKVFIRSFFVYMVVILLLCSCSTDTVKNELSENGGTSLSITFSDGSTKNMSVQELIDLSDNDGRKFKEIKLIKGEGKVTNVGSVEQAQWDYDTKRPIGWAVDVSIGKDVNLHIYVKSTSDIPELYNGDIIEFSGSCGGTERPNKVCVSYHCQIDGHYVKLK